MVSICPARPRRLLALLLVLVAVLVVAAQPAPVAQAANNPPAWIAVAVVADFVDNKSEISYTVFGGRQGNPVEILAFSTEDITDDCSFTDISYSGGYASFNGSSSQIVCDLSSLRDKIAELYPNAPLLPEVMECSAGLAPLWVSADLRHGLVSGLNPVVVAPGLGIGLSFPSNGSAVRTAMVLGGNNYSSNPWKPSTPSTRVLMGMNGPAMIAIDDEFHWLDYLNPKWKQNFASLGGPNMRHWYESPIAASPANPPSSYTLQTGPTTLVIGHNPDNGQYFSGDLRYVRVDPGCPIN